MHRKPFNPCPSTVPRQIMIEKVKNPRTRRLMEQKNRKYYKPIFARWNIMCTQRRVFQRSHVYRMFTSTGEQLRLTRPNYQMIMISTEVTEKRPIGKCLLELS